MPLRGDGQIVRFAAGHRRLRMAGALCRHADYLAAKSSIVRIGRTPGNFGSVELDARSGPSSSGDMLLAWTPRGCGPPRAWPKGMARLITRPSLVALLAGGWRAAAPPLHPSAAQPR